MNEEKLRADFEALVTAPFWTNNVNHGHVFSVSKKVQGNMYVDTLTEYCWQVYKVMGRKLQHEADLLTSVVKMNHEWHQEHDEHDGYVGSELFNINTAALLQFNWEL